MTKKTTTGTRIGAIIVLVVFTLSLVAAEAIPLMNKKDASDQTDIQKQIEELQKQQEDQAPAEVDPNLKQEGAITTMQIIDITTGTGKEAKLGDTIKVKYKGALASSGEVFDSNSDGVEFPLKAGGLIDGWIEGVPGMREGGKRKLIIPSAKGYGPKGTTGIPPDSDLVFEIELVSISS
jgi:FK506-binding nuclear protein